MFLLPSNRKKNYQISCLKSRSTVFIKNIKKREFIFRIKEKKISDQQYICTVHVCTCILPKKPKQTTKVNIQNKKQCIGCDWEDNIACEQ